MKKTNCLFLWLLFGKLLFGQILQEETNVDYLKSIRFKSDHNEVQFPLIKLNEIFTLTFDDLKAQDNDYYYRIRYCNKDWTPSNLFQNEYLTGFDNQRIVDYQSSFGTLQRFTHYKLSLPNDYTGFKISGNYMLEIYNADEELMFSRKFLIYQDQVQVQLGVTNTQNTRKFSTHQNLAFSIVPQSLSIRNPMTDLHVLLMQNDQWDNAFFSPPPQYINGNRYEYGYDTQTQFEAGNEYLFFDTKDLRALTPNIRYVDREALYNHYLYTPLPRKELPYSEYPDINGDYLIRTLQGINAAIEADYSLVYFSLAEQYQLDDREIYIYGKFNNYALTDENKLIYNPQLEIYEGILLLKQGFYNYKYVEKTTRGMEKNSLSNNHSIAENAYLALVYHRGIGQQYDALIGWGRIRSYQLNY